MKYIVTFLLCMALAAPCFAASCQDMRDAVGGAIRERNGRVSDSHDILMPDPETERDALPAVSVPSMPLATPSLSA